MTIDGTTANKYTIDGVNAHPGLQVNIYVISSTPFEFTPGDLTLQNIKLTRMRRGRGGAILHDRDDGKLSLNNVEISNSRATNTGTVSGGGGAIYAETSMTITNSKFTNNVADTSSQIEGGGAILLDRTTTGAQTVSITNSEFINNSAPNGSATGGAILATSNRFTVTISGSAFRQNSAAHDGGAVVVNSSSMTINKSTFESNTAGRDGGAIRKFATGSLTVNNSTFSGNSANDGGAFYGENATLRHVTISGNSASNDAGGARFRGAEISVTPVTVHNSIIYGNSASGTGADVKQNCTGTPASGSVNNLIGNGDCGASLSANPLLGSLATVKVSGIDQKYFPLQMHSPALEAGNATQCGLLTTDQIGGTRPQPGSTTCDLGAVESDTRASTNTPTKTATAAPNTNTPTATATLRPNNVTLNGTACNIYDAISAANSNTATGNCPAGMADSSGADVIVLTSKHHTQRRAAGCEVHHEH